METIFFYFMGQRLRGKVLYILGKFLCAFAHLSGIVFWV